MIACDEHQDRSRLWCEECHDLARKALAAVEALCDDVHASYRTGSDTLRFAMKVRAAARGDGDRPAPSSIVRLTGFQTQLDAARGEDK